MLRITVALLTGLCLTATSRAQGTLRDSRSNVELQRLDRGDRKEPDVVGLIQHDDAAFQGFTLFAPIASTRTYLIDNDGVLVNSWRSEFRPGLSAYLLENGHLLRTAQIDAQGGRFRSGGAGGRVEEYDWNGTLVWKFEYSNAKVMQHHDIEPLPSGNILMIAWEYFSAEEASAAGRDPRLTESRGLWVDHIIEVEPSGESGGGIVWQWSLWDHVIQERDPNKPNYGKVADHPELLDLNYSPPRGRRPANPDWTHFNSIDFNPQLDQVLISCHGTSEIFVIDHSTTTDEAAAHIGGRSGRGGDILYRWGNPAMYGAGSEDDRKLFAQHDAQWIAPGSPGAGNILIFNNGLDRPNGRYSSVEEIVPPLDANGQYEFEPNRAFGPAEAKWTYTAEEPMEFFSGHISGAQRLPNGNTLVCCGAVGWFFEVAQNGSLVWQYVVPPSQHGQGTDRATAGPRRRARGGRDVFRAVRYAQDFPGFSGKGRVADPAVEGTRNSLSTKQTRTEILNHED